MKRYDSFDKNVSQPFQLSKEGNIILSWCVKMGGFASPWQVSHPLPDLSISEVSESNGEFNQPPGIEIEALTLIELNIFLHGI